jgi:hypothetical protein
MSDFFISYNREDRAWAEWVAWQLEATGYKTKLQAWDFRPGSNFVLEMNQASIEADRTIAILSPSYLASLFCRPEWATAFAQDPTSQKGMLIPVRVRECELKGLLSQIVYIDLVGLEETAAKKTLFDGVRHKRGKPTRPPHFPGAMRRTGSSPPHFPGAPANAEEPSSESLPQDSYTRADIRKAVTRALSDEELDAFCMDHFPEVYEKFSSGMGKTQKVLRLIEYCSRREQLPRLLDLLRVENPEAFKGI